MRKLCNCSGKRALKMNMTDLINTPDVFPWESSRVSASCRHLCSRRNKSRASTPRGRKTRLVRLAPECEQVRMRNAKGFDVLGIRLRRLFTARAGFSLRKNFNNLNQGLCLWIKRMDHEMQNYFRLKLFYFKFTKRINLMQLAEVARAIWGYFDLRPHGALWLVPAFCIFTPRACYYVYLCSTSQRQKEAFCRLMERARGNPFDDKRCESVARASKKCIQ